MGTATSLTSVPGAAAPGKRNDIARLPRRRPRSFVEWQALQRWGKLPPRETQVAGYLLRQARESVGLTQHDLGRRLGVSQQAIAQAERWGANPTVDFMRRFLSACGAVLHLGFETATILSPTR